MDQDQASAIAIGFDDAFASVYTEAYPLMKARGLRGTIYVPTFYIGQAGYMTVEQLQEMYADGWDISSHGKTATPLAGLTYEQQLVEINDAMDALDGWGFTRSSRYVAYSGGSYDSNTLLVMAATGQLTGRTVATNRINEYPITAPYLLYNWAVFGSSVSLAAMKVHFDNIRAGNFTSIIYGHKLAATAEDNNTWAIADFQVAMDYLITLPIVCLTISELHTLNTATVSHKHRMDW